MCVCLPYLGPRGVRIGSGEGSNSYLYHSPNIVKVIKYRRLRWAGHVTEMEDGRRAFKTSTGEPEEKSPLGRPRRREEGSVTMCLKETGVNSSN